MPVTDSSLNHGPSPSQTCGMGSYGFFHQSQFIHAQVCLILLPYIKNSKSNKNDSFCKRPIITLKYCWPRLDKNIERNTKVKIKIINAPIFGTYIFQVSVSMLPVVKSKTL